LPEVWRFIPTGVGNGRARDWRSCRKPVHPHGRGERLRPSW